jgi:hypothetical protein
LAHILGGGALEVTPLKTELRQLGGQALVQDRRRKSALRVVEQVLEKRQEIRGAVG